jgi:hypothetical protein
MPFDEKISISLLFYGQCVPKGSLLRFLKSINRSPIMVLEEKEERIIIGIKW